MVQKATTTTPDPELSTPLGSGNEVNANAPTQGPSGENGGSASADQAATRPKERPTQPAGQTCEQGGCI